MEFTPPWRLNLTTLIFSWQCCRFYSFSWCYWSLVFDSWCWRDITDISPPRFHASHVPTSSRHPRTSWHPVHYWSDCLQLCRKCDCWSSWRRCPVVNLTILKEEKRQQIYRHVLRYHFTRATSSLSHTLVLLHAMQLKSLPIIPVRMPSISLPLCKDPCPFANLEAVFIFRSAVTLKVPTSLHDSI